ncbi:TonB-dependent receptor [uncultured Bacteroides sp.]|uniref:TonB-dependent receptor n=1 Tax=uncultured Bacteroides sp. TaxID=162156 RepID=UPI002AA9496B|nr:TonB-dependent receptor [uncultured Bacteroides sp.]
MFNSKTVKMFKRCTFSLICAFALFTSHCYSQNTKLSINKKNAAIIQILNTIEKKSDYVFFFPDEVQEEMNKKVDISAQGQTLNQILDNILRPTDLSYKITNRQVTIVKKTKTNTSHLKTPQTEVEISGDIKDSETDAPLMNVNIYIKELGTGTSTDENGAYRFALPKGKYTLVISYIGYKTKTTHIDVATPARFDFSLASDTRLEEVVVYADKKDENVTRTNMGVEKLSIGEIRKMPSLMGEVDIIKAIQLLPGVQPTAEGGSGYSVRGGSADQNLILIDNATVYNASHMFGFFSVFNNDVVENVELYKGDLPMMYGGRLSSLLNVQLKDNYVGKLKGSGGLGLISSRLMLEGSMGNKTSWMVGGRRSYADLFLKLSSDKSINQSSIYFYDLNGKITHRFSDKDKLSINMYIGNDNFGASSVAKFSYGNKVASMTWGHIFSENVLSKISFNVTNYHYLLQSDLDNFEIKWKSNITDLTLRWDFNHSVNRNLKLTYGATSILHRFNPGLITQPDYPDFKIPSNYALEHGLYLSAEQKLTEHLTLRYGLRWSVFQNMGSATVYKYDTNHEVSDSTHYASGKIYHTYQALEPRIGMVYKLTENSSMKANYARNTQFIQLANNSSSGSPLDLWFPASPNVKPQSMDMISAGYFRNFNQDAIELSAEVYYKKLNNVIDFADHAQLLLNSKLDGEIRTGKGKAYGLELMVRKNTGRLTGFANYTLSRSERTIPGINNGKTYLSPYDKMHSINLSASYELSKRWNISAAWIYATGNPTSYPTGRFEIGGEYFPIYSGRNEYRRTDYHRLDLSVNYVPKPKPGRKWTGEWNFSLYNAYGHKNPWIITYDQNTPTGIPDAKMTYLFGAVPSITYNFKF